MRKLTLVILMCMLMVFSVMVVACDNNQEQDPSTHEHTYSSAWSSNETHHWHAATCEHSDEVSDKAEHSYGDDNKCICGKEKSEQQPGGSGTHSHTYSDKWTHDETHHWHEATCEHTDLVKDKEEHNYGADNKCVCGKEKNEEVQPPTMEEVAGTYYFWEWDDDQKDYFITKEPYIHLNADGTGGFIDNDRTTVTFTLEGSNISIVFYDGRYIESYNGIYKDGILVLSDSIFSRAAVLSKEKVNPFKKYDNVKYCLGIDGNFSVTNVTDRNITSANIKNEINGVSVTSIGYAAFWGCRSLASVTIPDSITIIGNCVFGWCESIVSITIPNSVTSIGDDRVFAYCRSLENITVESNNPVYHSNGNCLIETATKTLIAGCKNSVIPTDGSVTSVWNDAFNGCSSLVSITIPDSVTNIGENAFNDCSSLVSITIPDSVTSIGNYAFSNCSSLERIIIPDSVTSIGDGAFSGCSSLESITIPDSVTSIGDGAFYNCSSLESITIPNSVTSIGSAAFGYCSSLESIAIPNSVTSIGDETFEYCQRLESITIGNSITSIGNYAFYRCSSLESITIPDSVTSIGERAFEGCSSLESITIPDSVTSIGERAFEGCSSLESITIPSVTSIGYMTFGYCSSLESIAIPDSVTIIGNSAFYGCGSLKSITIPSVTSIGERAFYGCSGLESITIPSVTSIGGSAFAECDSLESIIIPSVTNIEDYAFYNCSSLESITIGNSVTSIGEYAFKYCRSLESVFYKGTAEEWSNISIDWGNDELTSPTRYYYSESEPTEEQWSESENWWHYVDGEPVIWGKDN